MIKAVGECDFSAQETAHTDGRATMRLFGFDSSVRKKLLEGGSGSSIVILNCEIKKSRVGEQVEACYAPTVCYDDAVCLCR